MSQYSETIRQWATDTRRAGYLKQADGVGEVGLKASEAGRRLAVRFMLKVEVDRVADARYEVFGCGFSMAACAVAADMAIGYRLQDLVAIDAQHLNRHLDGLPPERGYCTELALEALHAAARSALEGRRKVEADVSGDIVHGPRISPDHPVYRTLMKTARPSSVAEEDRHLFACLCAVAGENSSDPASALGLDPADLRALLTRYFPGVACSDIFKPGRPDASPLPESNPEVLAVLLAHVPTEAWQGCLQTSVWLAYILAQRAALPGHLWVAMGLTKRPQLTAAIRRHLPSLAEANSQNMRWKRYLYKQVCDLNGGMMCKAPNCGVCSDYHLCFAEE